jgi:hypothetical protein
MSNIPIWFSPCNKLITEALMNHYGFAYAGTCSLDEDDVTLEFELCSDDVLDSKEGWLFSMEIPEAIDIYCDGAAFSCNFEGDDPFEVIVGCKATIDYIVQKYKEKYYKQLTLF